jgi:hypothetical protein
MKNIIKGFYLTLKERKFIYKLFAFYIVVYTIFYLMLKTALKPLDYMAHIGDSVKNLDWTYLLLFLKKHPDIGTLSFSLFISFFILYFFYSQYILKSFTEKIGEKQASLKNYRKILLSWLYFIPVFVVYMMVIIKIYLKNRELIVSSPTTSSILYYLFIIFSIFFFVYIFAVFDTTRIMSIYKDKNSLKSFFSSFGFSLKKYLNFFFIYLFYGISGFLLFFIYRMIVNLLSNQLWAVPIILVLFHLLFFFFHLFIKFSLFASEFNLIKGKNREVKASETTI